MSRRIPRWVWWISAGVPAAYAVLLLWANSVPRPSYTPEFRLCQLEYREARTHRDTLTVDHDQPVVPVGGHGGFGTCGGHRRSGELAQWEITQAVAQPTPVAPPRAYATLILGVLALGFLVLFPLLAWVWLRVAPRLAKHYDIPPHWPALIRRNVALTLGLPPDDWELLLQHVARFIDGVRFEGCAGKRLTEETRLTIAAQACLLTLRHGPEAYSRLREILVYPSPFSTPPDQEGATSIPRLGESWSTGTVVLAWDEAVAGGEDPADGQNLVFHEFAHQLDLGGNGIPSIVESARREVWERLLTEELVDLRRATKRGRPTALDHYGARRPAELFAVATEVFLELPDFLLARNPELFAELIAAFRFDPRVWQARLKADSGVPSAGA